MGKNQDDQILEILDFHLIKKKKMNMLCFSLVTIENPKANVSSMNYFTNHYLNRTNVMPSH